MTKREQLLTVTGMVRALDPRRGLRWRDRFQVRLAAYFILLSLAASLIAGYVSYTRQVEFVEAEQEQRGYTLISNLAGQCELGAYAGDRVFLTVPVQRALWEEDVTYVAVYDRNGESLIQAAKPRAAADFALPQPLRQRILAAPGAPPLSRRGAEHDDLLAPIVSLDLDAEQAFFGDAGGASRAVGVVRLGLSRAPAERKLREVLRWGIYLGGMILAIGMLLALFLARRVSQPILELARGTDAIRRGELGYQIELPRSDEVGLLAQSFNRMSAKLQETVASLAHLNRNLEQEVARQTVVLRRSRDFVAMLNAPLQLHRLVDTALEALVSSTGAIGGAAYVAGEGGGLELSVAQGALRQEPAELRAFAERIVAAGGADPHAPMAEAQAVAQRLPQVDSLLSVPARYRDRLEAIVLLALAAPLEPDQVDFVDHAASELAIAVSNARAYAETERLAQQLEQRNVALLQQRDELQQVNRLKSEFLANISHELRTPLNAIIGYAELQAEEIYGPVTAQQAQALAGIRENANNLRSLIDDILDLSKVEAGRMTVAVAAVRLDELAREVAEAAAPLVRDRPYGVRLELPDDAVIVQTDAAKVRQIVVNLLSNAIKFTERGSVAIAVQGTAGGGARITVSDTGIGIARADLKVIFDEFRQVDGSSTRRHGGTGLGLAICRKLAHLIGANIRVRSEPGQGSSFSLLLSGAGARRAHEGTVETEAGGEPTTEKEA